MKVYLVPLGGDRYELYCEIADGSDPDDGDAPGFLKRWYADFRRTLRAAEVGRRRVRPSSDTSLGRRWLRAARDRTIRWMAESIAEQRLLWHLRRQTEVVLAYPPDLDDGAAMNITRRALQRDADRHRFWLVFDAVGLIVSALFMIVPGPNLLAYYFTFRVVGHYFSRRGARQGLDRVIWHTETCAPLVDLRQALVLDPSQRGRLVREIAVRLELEHLAAFFERTATRSA